MQAIIATLLFFISSSISPLVLKPFFVFWAYYSFYFIFQKCTNLNFYVDICEQFVFSIFYFTLLFFCDYIKYTGSRRNVRRMLNEKLHQNSLMRKITFSYSIVFFFLIILLSIIYYFTAYHNFLQNHTRISRQLAKTISNQVVHRAANLTI